MKVILLQDIYKHGVAGEIAEVADGFARNYLIPRKMAVKATKGALKSHEKLQEQVEIRRAKYENMLNDLARRIDGVELFFERRAAATGKLFGSVTTADIAEELDKQTGVDINRRRVSQQAVRELGSHQVPVRLGTDESPLLTITVVREGEMEEFLAARKAAEKAGEAAPEPGEIGEGAAFDTNVGTGASGGVEVSVTASEAEALAEAGIDTDATVIETPSDADES
jgi:large subunit ribosomal protein L9